MNSVDLSVSGAASSRGAIAGATSTRRAIAGPDHPRAPGVDFGRNSENMGGVKANGPVGDFNRNDCLGGDGG